MMSFILMVCVIWMSGVVFVAACMGIIKLLEILESSDDF